jgi:Zn ribbon nucleic-acid-binding protein
MDKVADNLDVSMNYTNAQDHVPEAERNNIMIKECVRAGFHHLPYKKVPRTMLKYLAITQINHLNIFPAKGGISPYYSPKVILIQ